MKLERQDRESRGSSPAPTFLLADDDERATAAIMLALWPEWYYIPICDPRQVIRYAKKFATTAIFLADGIAYSERGGVAKLVQELLDEVGKPVVVLTEIWSPEAAERWKRMGAYDCIPHPTRTAEKLDLMRSKVRELAHLAAG